MQKQQEILFPRRDASSEGHVSWSSGFEPCEDDGSRIPQGWNPFLLSTWRITSHLETPLFPRCMESAFVSSELSTWSRGTAVCSAGVGHVLLVLSVRVSRKSEPGARQRPPERRRLGSLLSGPRDPALTPSQWWSWGGASVFRCEKAS